MFQNLSPHSHDATQKAFSALLCAAEDKGHLAASAAPWSLCELNLNEEDWEWLQSWARSIEPDQAKKWTSLHHDFFFQEAGQTFSSIPAFGLVFLAFCTESVRRFGSEEEFWRAVRCNEENYPRFAKAHRVFWSDGGAPRGCLYRSLKQAAYLWNLRHCFRNADEHEYVGTIRLQFGFTRAGAQKIAHWLCGYSWPAPVRDLVRGHTNYSASFGRFWSDLHALRDGEISSEEWKNRHIGSSWILPEWAEELCENARAFSGLRYVNNTRVGAQNSRVSQALTAIWGAHSSSMGQSSPFLGDVRLHLEGLNPVFRVNTRDFFLPQGQNQPEMGSLSLYIGDECITTWVRQGQNGRYRPTLEHFELSAIEPQFTAFLVAGKEKVVAKQKLELWDVRDGFGWWNLQTERRCDVWRTVPNPNTSYALLIDGDLTVEPLPAQHQKIGGRHFLLPDSAWFQNARILEEGQHFWKAPQKDEPSWAGDLVLRIPRKQAAVQLGQNWELEACHAATIEVRSLRWAGRLFALENTQEQANASSGKIVTTFLAPTLSVDNVAATISLEAELIHIPSGEQTTVLRRFSLPIQAALWRCVSHAKENTEQTWHLAKPNEIWDVSEEREWKIWGDWSEGAQLCLGGVPFSSVPKRSRILRPPHPTGGGLSVREAPFGKKQTRLSLARSVRYSGSVCDFKRRAPREVHVKIRRGEAPNSAHTVVIWGQGGLVAVSKGDEIVCNDGVWLVPFSFPWQREFPWQRADVPILGVGLGYEGVWIGAHFKDHWRELCPTKWDAQRAFDFALLARWMRLPWNEDRSLYFQMAREWPIETLQAWLGKPANTWGLRFQDEGADLVRNVFRSSWNASHAQTMSFVRAWNEKGGTPLQLMRVLGETDPFLLLAIARVWADGQPGFVRLFGHVVTHLKNHWGHASSLPNTPEAMRFARLVRARFQGEELDEVDERILQLSLDSPSARQFCALRLLEHLQLELS